MRVKFGNTTKDVSILEVTPENYIVPKGEEGVYHCRIEQKSFNASTGERQSRPRIQKFRPKMWPMLSRNLKLQGWTVEVMHDPTEWIKQQEEKAAMTEAERIRQRQEAEAQRKAEEKAALKAEIIAELKAAGMIAEPKAEQEQKPKTEPKTGGSNKKK